MSYNHAIKLKQRWRHLSRTARSGRLISSLEPALVTRDARRGAAKEYGMRNLRKFAGVIGALMWPGAGLAQEGYADPAGSGPLVGAVRWLEGTLLGTVATVVAVIAVAVVGFLMLTGRMNWRYGATVILGCFILFGAGSIVGGIQSSASAGAGY